MPKYMLTCGDLDGPTAMKSPRFKTYLDSLGQALNCPPFVLDKKIYVNMASDITQPWVEWLAKNGITVWQG
jgi:hypothetical protein